MSGEELRALAEAATPGPWGVAKWHSGTVITERWAQEWNEPGDRGPFTSIGSSNNEEAAFIAAANPAAVLALLDTVSRVEALLGEPVGPLLDGFARDVIRKALDGPQ